MRFFKKSIEKREGTTLSGLLTERTVRYQHQLARYLNRKTNFLSGKAQVFALILFCLLFGTYCLFLITSAFN